MSDYNDQYFMDRPACDYMARKLSFGYLMKVMDRYLSLQIHKSVNNIKSISPTRRDLIIKKRYMQLINKYNLENKWINL